LNVLAFSTYDFRFVLLIKYYLGEDIKENGIGRACGTQEKCVQHFGGETCRYAATSENYPLSKTYY